jgi:tritrans,polycis-undecaprenyl-diphosphate synthase [geranylgeranyl-diphosphate specific]
MHVGLIPDGHRRYARENNISNKESYLMSHDRIDEIIDFINKDKFEHIDENIYELTIYALSEDNLQRDEEELSVFYDALSVYLKELLENERLSVCEDEVNISFISTKKDALPKRILELSKKVREKYTGNKIDVNILLSYSGKKEIVEAASNIDNPDTDRIRDNLQLNSEIDYVIRTGDNATRECLSGFCLWQSSYSEYYHIQKNFPKVRKNDIKGAIKHYSDLRRKRGE